MSSGVCRRGFAARSLEQKHFARRPSRRRLLLERRRSSAYLELFQTAARTVGRGVCTMFIQTEATPNPATLKFLPGKEVLPSGTADFRDAETAAASSPLAGRLFDITGVTGVFFCYDFITVTNDGSSEWQNLQPAHLRTITGH